ncbi:MAG: S41 family peptidase [Gammaproteobacteria bacterium]|nr:S41 family peptidase [Gammaproteobacteria bacterium]
MPSRRIRLPASVALLAACLFALPATAASAPTAPESPALPLEELRAFAEVLDRIRSAYVEEVDDRTLFENAIEGMLSRLDPHSSYLNEEAYRSLQEATSGEFGGVGLEVDHEDGLVRVVAPMDGTPAERAGLLPGDLIIRIDDRPVRDMTLSEAVNAMRGEVGSVVELSVRRPGTVELMELSLVRSRIEVPSVSASMLEPGFGYLRVAQFQNRTGNDLRRELARLQDEAEGGLRGLILDLRNNPGGVLQASVAVADTFLASGRIVYTEGRLPSAQVSYSANGEDLGAGVPLIVLINEGSASAAEIVAGALQDHRRAVVLGTPSFGKGSVQTILPLSDERAIKLTTALYFTPGGRSIQAHGIVPDIRVERETNRPRESRSAPREVDLPRHLRGNGESGDSPATSVASDDRQIMEALNILRGMHLLGRSIP